jgi:hypothetical protein
MVSAILALPRALLPGKNDQKGEKLVHNVLLKET